MLSGRIQCHLYWAIFSPIRNTIVNQATMQKTLILIIVRSLSGLKHSILEQKMCITKIMGLIGHGSVNFEMDNNSFSSATQQTFTCLNSTAEILERLRFPDC